MIGFGEEKRTYDEMTEFLYQHHPDPVNYNMPDSLKYHPFGIPLSPNLYHSHTTQTLYTNSDSSDDYDDGIDSNGFYEE